MRMPTPPVQVEGLLCPGAQHHTTIPSPSTPTKAMGPTASTSLHIHHRSPAIRLPTTLPPRNRFHPTSITSPLLTALALARTEQQLLLTGRPRARQMLPLVNGFTASQVPPRVTRLLPCRRSTAHLCNSRSPTSATTASPPRPTASLLARQRGLYPR